MKKAIAILWIIILVIGACGRGMKTVKNEKNNVVPYLQDKYGEVFVLSTYEMRSIDIPYDEAVCTNSLGQKVKVYIDYENENAVMTDDYYGILKKPQYVEELRAILKECGIECKLFTQFAANYFDSAYNQNTPLNQAMAENKEQFYTRTFLFISENVQINENSLAQICEILLQNNMTMYLAVYQVSAETYALIDETQEAGNYIHREDGVRLLYEEVVK